MQTTLANKYRPHTFDEVIGQTTTIKILKRQLELHEFKNCYLFAGPSGVGKTTLARIFANEINKGLGTPIEIDGASNNGVDNVRNIIAGATQHALDSEYKVYIIDEAHMITIQGWNAFLKCIEEPPVFTIFIFCTTNPEKIPATILNRVQQYHLTKVNPNLIKTKLLQICKSEKEQALINYEEACSYISNICNGGVRDALALLDKAISYSSDLSINNVIQALGAIKYDDFFNMTNAVIDKDEATVINIIEMNYKNGVDLVSFINVYLDFVIDLAKYCLFKDMTQLSIPSSMENQVIFVTGADQGNNIKFFNEFISKVLAIKTAIRYDVHAKTTILAMFMEMCK